LFVHFLYLKEKFFFKIDCGVINNSINMNNESRLINLAKEIKDLKVQFDLLREVVRESNIQNEAALKEIKLNLSTNNRSVNTAKPKTTNNKRKSSRVNDGSDFNIQKSNSMNFFKHYYAIETDEAIKKFNISQSVIEKAEEDAKNQASYKSKSDYEKRKAEAAMIWKSISKSISSSVKSHLDVLKQEEERKESKVAKPETQDDGDINEKMFYGTDDLELDNNIIDDQF
jgi:hypothetical protein